MNILWNQFVKIDNICNFNIFFSLSFSSSLESWFSPISFNLFKILVTKDSLVINLETQLVLVSIGILLYLQNLSSNTRLFTNFKFNNILYKLGSEITVINSTPVALLIILSGYFISENNFHISSFIKLSSSFNISNNKLILSSSKGIIISSSFLITIFFFCSSSFLFLSISSLKLLILFSTVKYIIVFSISPICFFSASLTKSSSYIPLNTTFI